jgi:hypothetical protein
MYKDQLGERSVEVLVPGAHSDIGGGYDNGIWKLTLEMARDLLRRQGLMVAPAERVQDVQTTLNLGRHNSDWINLGDQQNIANAALELNRPIESAEIGASPIPSTGEKVERGMREVQAKIDEFEQVKQQSATGSAPMMGWLSIQITPTKSGFDLWSNCTSHQFELDTNEHAVTMDGEVFIPISKNQLATLGDGMIMMYAPKLASAWRQR